jgi:hypothetical protein
VVVRFIGRMYEDSRVSQNFGCAFAHVMRKDGNGFVECDILESVGKRQRILAIKTTGDLSCRFSFFKQRRCL